MSINTEEFLRFKCGLLRNNLANIIHVAHSESHVTVHTKYYNVEDLSEFLDKYKTKLTILSLNIESLNSKSDDLSILVNTLAKSNTLINIICIQEARIRQGTDIEHLKLDGYSMITQPYTDKCSQRKVGLSLMYLIISTLLISRHLILLQLGKVYHLTLLITPIQTPIFISLETFYHPPCTTIN